MKILIIHYRYFISGGPERYMFNVMNALEKKGHTVIPFSIKNSKNLKCDYDKYFVDNIGNSNEVFIDKYKKSFKTYVDLIGREFYSFKVKKALTKLIKDTCPDVCYLLVYKRALSPSVIDVCKKFDIPIINRISDYNTVCGNGALYRNGEYCDCCINSDFNCFKYSCIKQNKIYSFLRFLSIKFHKFLGFENKIDTFVCTNDFMFKMMVRYGYDPKKLKTIPTFFKNDSKYEKLDKTNHIDSKLIKFLFIGNIDESKGIYDLLSALKLLINSNIKNFHLDIVGGIRQEEINKTNLIISEYGLYDNVSIVPFVKSDEVFNYYLNNNITIIPARWVENLPNTLIESIYFHRPVVVPNFGSFMYTTDDSISFRFKAFSDKDLFITLKKIIDNPMEIDKKSINCFNYFNRNYSEQNHINSLISLFDSSLRR